MPWIRFIRWNYLTKLAPHVAITPAGRRYLWDGTNEGAVFVPFHDDVRFLLDPPGDMASVYDVAWEKYGVRFDQGKEVVMVPDPQPLLNVTSYEDNDESAPITATVATKTSILPRFKRGPGRPRKS